MKKITVGELFAGVGAFSLGLERTGYFETKWQVEIDPEARRVLRKHWPDVRRYMDVKKVGAHNLEPVDVIVFGSPCQGLSVSGKGEGLADERSGLFHEAIRICKELHPAVAIWENVPGAFSSNNSKDFLCVLHSFRECGAVDISWRVLDGRYFGVPQRRRRIFLIADFVGHRAGRVLFESPCVPRHTAAGKKKRKGAAIRTRGSTGGEGGGRGRGKEQRLIGGADGLARCVTTGQRYDLDTENFVISPTIAATLRGSDGRRGGQSGGAGIDNLIIAPKVAAPLTADGRPNSNASGHRREDDTNIVAFHATQDPISGPASPAMGTGNKEGCGSIAVAYTVHGAHSCARERHAFETDTAKCLDTTGGLASNQGGTVVAFSERGRESGSQLELESEDVMPTLRAGIKRQLGVFQRMVLRRLVPQECLRLMSLPDDHLDVEPPLSDSSKYRLCGNSIIVNVVEWLGRRLAASWENLDP